MTASDITLGGLHVLGLRDGFFSLDGGAMFGVVPKTLWTRAFRADDRNRITLGLNSFLIRGEGRTVLVETGIGDRLTDRLSALYGLFREEGLVAALGRAGVRPEDVDVVVNTHLHFDHCGGNTRRSEDGSLVPVFPRAEYVVQKEEWEDALHPNDRDKGSYLPDNFVPLERAGLLRLVEGEARVSPGVTVVPAPGHTRGHQAVKVEGGGRTLFILGDMVPTAAHVRTSYVMSYDLFPVETMRQKKKFYEEGLAGGWVYGFIHDPEHFFGRVAKKNEKYEFQPFVIEPKSG
ncbi:MAG: MBL fold metallo-hydrolase [Candidatus Aminicenantes bacterium]|nr:MBL fold metallo-hydrolase [Candidatus Aminicenantes bacterium]